MIDPFYVRQVVLHLALWFLLLCPAIHAEQSDDVADHIAAILQTGPNGAGSAAARRASDALSQHELEILPQLLTAMDTPNAIAANWLRTVADPIVERGLESKTTDWPVEFLKEYVSDAKRRGRPREWALDLLERLEPEFRAQWIRTRLDDPAFRFQAVAAALAAGEKALAENRNDEARSEFRKAFQHARDAGQVTQASTQLKALGENADVAAHLGLMTDWRLIGPFDAPEKTGYETVFPPEQKLDLAASYPGKDGVEIKWIEHRTADVLGTVNLNDALAATREAVGYAYAEIEVAADRPAELRCGADDNCTIWLNGRKVFGRDQWLNGTRFDRFITPVSLKAGRNTVLVKICQGPQHRDPEVPNNWTFQIRLCDADGLGIEFKPVK
jgi:hypothetical protein